MHGKRWYARFFYHALYGKRMLEAMESVADCAVRFLPSDVPRTTGYDLVAFLGFGHILAEVPREQVVDILRMNFWNDGILIRKEASEMITATSEWDKEYWSRDI